mmetsp:Transcript_80552/g.224125  ORF Transcript_80552/g.224125 Transcript_80552/m.224125 type:complete len:230 (-) Transcript_80552:1646-2335(-)
MASWPGADPTRKIINRLGNLFSKVLHSLLRGGLCVDAHDIFGTAGPDESSRTRTGKSDQLINLVLKACGLDASSFRIRRLESPTVGHSDLQLAVRQILVLCEPILRRPIQRVEHRLHRQEVRKSVADRFIDHLSQHEQEFCWLFSLTLPRRSFHAGDKLLAEDDRPVSVRLEVNTNVHCLRLVMQVLDACLGADDILVRYLLGDMRGRGAVGVCGLHNAKAQPADAAQA